MSAVVHSLSVSAAAHTLRLCPLATVNAGAVEQLALRSPSGWVQHLPVWARIAEDIFGRRDLSLGVVQEPSGRLIGLCPLGLKQTWGFRILESAAFGGYGGPVLADDLPPEVREETSRLMTAGIDETARRHRADSIDLCPFPGGDMDGAASAPDWTSAGYQPRPYQLYLLDLSAPLETLLKQMEQNARHAIRQAQRYEVVVTRDESPQALETFYALFVQAHRRSGAHILPHDYFSRLRQTWGSSGKVFEFFMASHEGQPVAAALVGAWKQWAIYSSNGSNAEGLRLRANHLLQWEIMGWLKQQGIRWYELGRWQPGFESEKQQRIDFFKTRFGVRTVPVMRWRRDVRAIRTAVYETLRPWATRMRSR